MATLSAISQKGLNSDVTLSGCLLQQNSDSDLVLETIAGANTGDYVFSNTNATGANTADIPFDWPVDFGNPSTATSLSVRLQYALQTGTRVNTWSSLQATLVDSGGSALSNTITLASNITTTTATNTSVVAFTGLNTTAGAAVWQAARLRITINITRSMGGDTLEKRVFAGELTGTYTLAALELTQNARFNNSNTFYSATITAGAVTLTPSLYSNTQTFYSPTVSGAIPPQELTPSLYTNTQVFYTPTVAAGTVTLLPSLYTNNNTIYSATVSVGSVTLQPTLYSNNQTYYTHNIATGASTLVPELYTNTSVFYSAVVTGVGTFLSPQRYNNTNTFYSATVTPAAVNLAPTLLANSSAFYSPLVELAAVTLAPSRVGNIVEFFTPNLVYDQTLSPAFFNNAGAQGDLPYVLKYWTGTDWLIMYKNPTFY